MLLRPEFFATDEAVAQLEAALRAAEAPAERLPVLLNLAWQVRQRDWSRALALADEAQQLMQGLAPSNPAFRIRLVRVHLIRGEVHCLQAELQAAEHLARRAMAEASTLGDAIGQADAHALLAMIAFDRGDVALIDRELEAMARAAAGEDLIRREYAELGRIRNWVFRDVLQAQRLWDQRQARGPSPESVGTRALAELTGGLMAAMSGDPGRAVLSLIEAHALASATGQLRWAILAMANVSVCFSELNDFETALDWVQRALSLARASSLRAVMGMVLLQAGDVSWRLQRHEAARELLQEALDLLAGQAESRHYAMALRLMADLDMAGGHFERAFKIFREVEQRAALMDAPDLLSTARVGQAKALLGAGEPARAFGVAQLALDGRRVGMTLRIAAFQIAAEVLSQHPEVVPADMAAPRPALRYLHLAMEAAAELEGYTMPAELLACMASEYAKAGDPMRAYELSLKAAEAREKTHSQNASKRAVALQVAHQTGRAQAEVERQRLLAQAHAERVASLEQANGTLEQLGVIGREITGNLEANAIIAALDRHVHALLDAFAFVIYRLEPDGQTLRTVFGLEDGVPLPQLTCRVDDVLGRVPLCARERREIVAHIEAADAQRLLVEGTAVTLSMMFAPLLVGERLLGVMTIQSPRPQAYGEREVAIFRTLCAYGAIALANAESQAQLIQSEKMASLGQLVANVAHEINTPIGAIKSSGATIVEALSDTLAGLPALLQALEPAMQAVLVDMIEQASRASLLQSSREERVVVKALTQALELAGLAPARSLASLLAQLGLSELPDAFLPLLRHPQRERILQAVQGVSTVVRSANNINTAVERVAKIVFALKRFSRVDSSGEWQAIDLVENIETVLTIYQNQIKQGCELLRRYEAELPLLLCLPDELNQVWTNLIHNALQAMPKNGRLILGIRREGEELVVSVGDNGCGIPEPIRARVFDPFFTTKPVGEGSGLGLNIVKKIVEKHRGRIELSSEMGVGTTFWVRLPLA